MQPAAVPCTGSNGMKRTAASAQLSETNASSSSSKSSNSFQSNNKYESQNSKESECRKSQSISPPPPEKRSFIVVESPLKLDTVDSAEDLDLKVLRIQNKNLSERVLQRKRLEEDLKEKIDGLQNRKLIDDNKICIIDRYWTQLDEDLRIMLERFDNSAMEHKNDKKPSSPAIRNFLNNLNDWDKFELDENLKDRAKFTTQTVAKLITNYDRMTKRLEQYYKEIGQLQDSSDEKMDTENNKNSKDKTSYVNDNVQEIVSENHRLNELITKCQQKSHSHGLERKQLEDQIVKLETSIKELSSKNDSTEYDLEKFRDKAFKLDRQLADTILKMNKALSEAQKNNNNQSDNKNGHNSSHNNAISQQTGRSDSKTTNLTDKQISELESDLKENKELSVSRLHELEKLNAQYQNSLKQIEKLKADLKLVPDSVISESSEYKQLQTKYSLVVSDNIKLKAALDESKGLIEACRVNFQRKLEDMESDELNQQKKLGNEMMQIEEQLTTVRKENELLRIEYEQNVAANEQTGPINKEMRSLITTLQTNNKLLKSDNIRTKKRLDEHTQEIEKLKKQIAQLQQQNSSLSEKSKSEVKNEPKTQSNELTEVKKENIDSVNTNNSDGQLKDNAQMKELQEMNQKLVEDKRDLKNLLEIYSKSNKQQLQSPNVSQNATSGSSTPSKHKIVELEEAKLEIKRLKESLDRYKSSSNKVIIPNQQISENSHHHHHHHHALDEQKNNPNNSSSSNVNHTGSVTSSLNIDYVKKIKLLEENIRELHKNLSSKKQEETALLNDMEITGQAFEDMQEQNVRLMQQLREKDDANFKLVSERIKLENVQKILKEEKEIYVKQVITLQEQLDTQMCISKKLEEQLLLANQTIMLSEKDIVHWQHSCENYRRQAIDHVQLIQDLKLNTQKYLSQLKEVQQHVAEKAEALASQSFINKRSQEDVKHLQIKIERQKKFEMASSLDEVLMEEIKEYKEQLRCPSCKVKQKDAVLTKCFHVFCFDCLQKRYDTRQRKCPKCNAGFGANDFRKLYLS